MPSAVLKVINPKGMHARAASKVVSIVSGYECKVVLSHKSVSAPGDSLLKLLTLDAPIGSEVTVDADGLGSENLLHDLKHLFEDGFGE